jgi:hypothetical protein
MIARDQLEDKQNQRAMEHVPGTDFIVAGYRFAPGNKLSGAKRKPAVAMSPAGNRTGRANETAGRPFYLCAS